MLDEITWRLVDKHDRKVVACLTAQILGTYGRHNAFIALLECKGVLTEEMRKRIAHQQGQCMGTAAKRNRIVHNAWYVNTADPEQVRAHRSMPKGDLRFGIHEPGDGEIEQILAEIEERREDVRRLNNDLLALPIS
jgi:hypothetical protein